jgi:hypothetical protein
LLPLDATEILRWIGETRSRISRAVYRGRGTFLASLLVTYDLRFFFSGTVENLKWDENDDPAARAKDVAIDLERNVCSQGVQVHEVIEIVEIRIIAI